MIPFFDVIENNVFFPNKKNWKLCLLNLNKVCPWLVLENRTPRKNFACTSREF